MVSVEVVKVFLHQGKDSAINHFICLPRFAKCSDVVDLARAPFLFKDLLLFVVFSA